MLVYNAQSISIWNLWYSVAWVALSFRTRKSFHMPLILSPQKLDFYNRISVYIYISILWQHAMYVCTVHWVAYTTGVESTVKSFALWLAVLNTSYGIHKVYSERVGMRGWDMNFICVSELMRVEWWRGSRAAWFQSILLPIYDMGVHCTLCIWLYVRLP